MRYILSLSVLFLSLTAGAQKSKNNIIKSDTGYMHFFTAKDIQYISLRQTTPTMKRKIQVIDSARLVAYVDTSGRLTVIDSLKTIQVLLKSLTQKY